MKNIALLLAFSCLASLNARDGSWSREDLVTKFIEYQEFDEELFLPAIQEWRNLELLPNVIGVTGITRPIEDTGTGPTGIIGITGTTESFAPTTIFGITGINLQNQAIPIMIILYDAALPHQNTTKNARGQE